jgi:hypothetical protein
MARGEILQPIKWAFQKWFARNKGTYTTPDNFANIARNIRIKDGVTPRKWYINVHYTAWQTPVRGIKSNGVQNKVYITHDSKLKDVNITTWAVTDIWSIATDNKCRFIEYGKYTIILTWADKPRFYDGTTLTQVTTTITAWVNPQFGVKFAWFTVINSQLDRNVIYTSRPITLANQERCYDWVGTGAEAITFDTPVVGMVSTLNNLWIFTKTTVEYIGKDSLTTTGGIASFFSIPLGTGNDLASPDWICAAEDLIFFMTKSRKIKSIGYIQGNVNPQIADISDVEWVGINDYMQNELDEDQSACFSFYDRLNNLVIWSVKSKGSSVNDRYIIRDLINKTFIEDTNKRFSCVTMLNDVYYTGSAYWLRVLKEFTGTLDNGDTVPRIYETTDMSFGNNTTQKQFRWVSIAWKINNKTKIKREVIVNNKTVLSRDIVGSDIVSSELLLWIWDYPIGNAPVSNQNEIESTLVTFKRVADYTNIRATGETIIMRFSGNENWQDFILDYMDTTILPRWHKYDKSYKI